MKRVRQTFKEIVDSLMPLEATWLDTHAEEVISVLKSLPHGLQPTSKDVRKILDDDFQVGFTVVRLFLDLSKDEFTIRLKNHFPGKGGIGITR